MKRYCPWCRRERETVNQKVRAYCPSCGHRLELAAKACDCRRCRPAPPPPPAK